MHGFLLQDWVTITGGSATPIAIQSTDGVLDLEAFQDFVGFVEVTDLNKGGATSATLYLESAPLNDDPLFTAQPAVAGVAAMQPNAALAVGTFAIKNLLTGPTVFVPLARFLRWRIVMAGASTPWSVTLRIHVAAHSIVVGEG